MLSNISTVAYQEVYGRVFQRKEFYARGRFWKFYSDGLNMILKTSTDGQNWSSPTIIRPCTSGVDFSIVFDDTYVHYVCALNTLRYRRGTPNVNGAITWSAAEQNISVTHDDTKHPTVSVDSNGYPWIGYMDVNLPYAIRSNNNDGSWAGVEVPHQLSTYNSSWWYVTVIALTAGKMLALYSRVWEPLWGVQWNGVAWGDPDSIFAYMPGYSYSAVAEGDRAHIVLVSNNKHIKYTTWYAGTFDTVITLASFFEIAGFNPVICRSGSDLYVFWANRPRIDHLYYIKRENGIWLDGVDYLTAAGLLGPSLTCFDRQRYGYVGIGFKTSFYPQLKFSYFTTDPYTPDPEPPPEPDVPTPPPVLEPEPTKKLDTSINASGSRHVYKPSQGHRQRSKRGRINRHITWVPVVIVKA